MTPAEVVVGLRGEARSLGFSLVGVTAPDPTTHMGFYEGWLEEGRHGEMAYLARADSRSRRAGLEKTMASVRSVVVVAHEYDATEDGDLTDDASRGVIARYARGDDYHDVMKKKLRALLSWLDGAVEGGVEGRAYVDTGPILERDLAQRAGLGWFGRNTMLIHPARGSYFFIGLLLVDVELPNDPPFAEDRCGTCRACLDACPTGALLGRDESGAPVIDARTCISYLTIELRGVIPRRLRPAIGNRIFGCDICQEVCPWNERFARATEEEAYRPRREFQGVGLVELAERLLAVDEDGPGDLFRKSPLRRAKRSGLLRNVCVALGNWGDEAAEAVLVSALDDEEPLVRGHAAWALGQVGSASAVAALEARAAVEGEGTWVGEELYSAIALSTG